MCGDFLTPPPFSTIVTEKCPALNTNFSLSLLLPDLSAPSTSEKSPLSSSYVLSEEYNSIFPPFPW